jgi:hypothetical protein
MTINQISSSLGYSRGWIGKGEDQGKCQVVVDVLRFVLIHAVVNRFPLGL